VAASWQSFVKQAIAGEPDDPFVAMLRRRVASGSKVLRVHLDAEARPPAYRVLLERLRELSELRIPHSPSFTRWSLDNAVRMATPDEEAQRFAMVAAERFQAVAAELGEPEANAVLVERLRALGPQEATAAVVEASTRRAPPPGRAHKRAAALVEGVLRDLAVDLGRRLRYPEAEVATILDGALARLARERLEDGAPRSRQAVAEG